ncbi:MAG: ABC transporter permease [Spirochaetaceae bacterium]|jgi:peptide/nickel transport system permease protein|nr:ABC transporter permease [Spirochaetaceae bacterium]
MVRFLLTTLARMILLLFGASALCFILVVNAPIDPVDAFVGTESNVSAEYRAEVAEHWGLTRPALERYFVWLKNVLHGDWGVSMTFRRPVTKILIERFSTSLVLMMTAWLFSGVLGFAAGTAAGFFKKSLFDRCVKTFCFICASTPAFWMGLLLLMVFAVQLGWFPIALSVPIGKAAGEVTILERIHHLILPALTLSITSISNITLHTRQKIIDVMESDYVLFAKARGETPWELIGRHGFRNIAIPALTLQFASFSELFGGSVLAENVFAYPGLGSAASIAGIRGDAPLLLGIAVFSALFVFMGNLAANLLYGLFNPEIREGDGAI